MRIRRRDVAQDHVEWDQPAREEARHVRQEDGDELGAALVHRRPGVRPDEERAMAEVRRHLGREVGTRALRVEVHHAHVVELGSSCHEGIEEGRRRGRGALEVDLVA